jgi:hypothetical protein
VDGVHLDRDGERHGERSGAAGGGTIVG